MSSIFSVKLSYRFDSATIKITLFSIAESIISSASLTEMAISFSHKICKPASADLKAARARKYGFFNKPDATRFRDIVSKGHVLAVLSGHLHCPFFTMVDGIYYVQAGSPVFENSYNGTRTPILLSYDSSSFNLLSYNEGRLLVKPKSFSKRTQLIKRSS
jgi:hypothetical protein